MLHEVLGFNATCCAQLSPPSAVLDYVNLYHDISVLRVLGCVGAREDGWYSSGLLVRGMNVLGPSVWGGLGGGNMGRLVVSSLCEWRSSLLPLLLTS